MSFGIPAFASSAQSAKSPSSLFIALALLVIPPAAPALAANAPAVASSVGGPLEPLDGAIVNPRADPEFHSLFSSWKKLDHVAQGVIAVPSQKPVEHMSFSSGFGVRSDPFRGYAAMHPGIDMPGPLGTPIYATADGVVGRAEWVNGYGKMIEVEHGKGVETRYGHLSQILVEPNTRVHRGDLIGRMGSTGRSTGNHLHYEVRIDGHAVNPMPFLQSADYLVALEQRVAHPGLPQVAMGGPDTEAGAGD